MSSKVAIKITKRAVDALAAGTQIWDSELKGFGVRRQVKRAHYFVSYRANGRRRFVTLGAHGPLTPESARREAIKLLGLVAHGKDPAAAREAEKLAGTVEELARRFIDDYARRHNKPSSIAEYERLFRLHIVPAFGTMRVGDITQADVARWHASFRSNPVAGNRALALLKHMFNLAEKWGLRSLGNPARLIEMNPEKPRERILSAAELARLGAALDAARRDGSEHPSVLACIRLLVFTGARLSEILKLRWEHIDFEHSALRLPDSKTGAKTIPLGAPALSLLSNLIHVEGEPYVCAGQIPGRHFIGIQRPWRRLRAAAGLPSLRIHDLRHAFASIAAMSGDSLLLIGKVLGHKQASTTERYAHLQDDPVRAVADRTARKIAALMNSEMAGSLVQINRKGA